MDTGLIGTDGFPIGRNHDTETILQKSALLLTAQAFVNLFNTQYIQILVPGMSANDEVLCVYIVVVLTAWWLWNTQVKMLKLGILRVG